MNKKHCFNYIIGCCFGDAHISKRKTINKNKSKKWSYSRCYVLELNVTDKNFVLYFFECLFQLTDKVSGIFLRNYAEDNWKQQYRVRTCDQQLIKRIMNSMNCFIFNIPGLMGIYDSEGSIIYSKKKGHRYISLSTCNKKIIPGLIKSLKRDCDIKPVRVYEDKRPGRKICYSVRFSGKDNLIKFRKKINFRIKEKSFNLDLAINSYKRK